MYALVVKLYLHTAADAAAFDRLVADTVAAIAEHEPHTVLYVAHTVEGEPLSRVIYEVYRDRDAFEEHQRQPHLRNFLEQRNNYVASARVEFLAPTTSKGLPATP
ncbi:putative quinol monooxygenase [Nocardia anaemiae]|uniref:putative quinol monooxygenase n=1 Tax=Nocardia anaemiae TaxID=263910 RepID=UPI0007A4F2D4|nr:antibiotic biosynthesis monooxygenase [Nocardia anaemiae]